MAYTRATRSQLKNVTAKQIIKALNRDGWKEEFKRGAARAFSKLENEHRKYITIHYHPKKTYNVGFLEKLLIDQAGWSESDLQRLKRIRKFKPPNPDT
jgi:predicted RNA binding protein YcfA (HicA-like mRNA interferase family)